MLGLRPTLSRRKGNVYGANVYSTAVGQWSMAQQVSTNGVLIDYSGFGHHGYYGGVKRAFIGDDVTGPRVCLFGAVASNTVTVAGLANSTSYDLVITYHDDTTDTHSLTTSGSGVMTMTASSDAKFTSMRVKSVAISLSGSPVDTVDFTAQAQGTRSFTTDGARTVTINQSADTAAMPTWLWLQDQGVTLWFPGTASNTITIPGLANSTLYNFSILYGDGTSDTDSGTTDGSGNLVLGATAAKFSTKYVARVLETGSGLFDVDIRSATINATHTSMVVATGQTVTINRSATGLKSTVVDENVVVFDGVDDYISIDDHARLDFGDAILFSVVAAVRAFGQSSTVQSLLAKRDVVLADLIGWELDAYQNVRVTADPGAGTTEDAVGTIALGNTRNLLVGRRTSSELRVFVNGVADTADSDIVTAALSNTTDVRIGSRVASGAYNSGYTGQFYTAAIFRRALSAAQILQLNREM